MATAIGSDIEQHSDETFELLCSPCKRKERNTEATKYCADCNDYYCTDCVKFHEDIPALSGHKIVDKGQAKAKDLPVAPTERCERHRFKPVDMYCQKHDDVGCYTCMAVDHRHKVLPSNTENSRARCRSDSNDSRQLLTCKDIFDIPEYVQNKQAFPDSRHIQNELQSTAGNLKECIEGRMREKERLLKSQEDALQSMYDFRRELNEKLDELEQQSVAAIEGKYRVLIQQIEDEIRILEDLQTEVKLVNNSFAMSGSNASQHFVCSKKGKRSVERASKNCEETSTRTEITDTCLYFRKEQILVSCLSDLNDIGRVRQKQTNELYSVRSRAHYNIRHQSDQTACTISSACVLEDGRIVLADQGNKKLKRIDRMYTIVDVCDLPEAPWLMCTVNRNEVAVLAWAGRTVTFVSVLDEMKNTREFRTGHQCYGIAAANDNIYVTDPRTSVLVYSMSGTKLKQFSKDQSGEALFKSLFGMAVSDDGMKIYVTDYTYGLVVLNKDGTLQGKYDCSELGDIRRVCVTDTGSVLVSGGSNKCILQFTPDGEKLGDVMAADDGNDECAAICFDNQRSRLLVGRRRKDEIDIYTVSTDPKDRCLHA